MCTHIPYALMWQGKLALTDQLGQVIVDITRAYVGESKNVEMKHDRLGRVSFSKMFIEFPQRVEETEIENATLRVINRIIDVYRYTKGEFFLERIPRTELRRLQIMTKLDNGQLDSEVIMREPQGAGVTLARFADIPSEAARILESGDELPVHSILLLNARRERFFENYRLAIVEAETAFEVYVDTIIVSHYRREGLSEAEITSKLDAGLKNLLKDHIPKVCGEHFVGTAEHSDWEKKAYHRRNAVVHDGASADDLGAEEAITCVEAAIHWMSSRVS